MAKPKSKDDITYGAAQAKLSEDEALRLAYKHGTPLESGKIADSATVDLFTSARNIPADGSSAAAATHQSNSESDRLRRRHDSKNECVRGSDSADPAAGGR